MRRDSAFVPEAGSSRHALQFEQVLVDDRDQVYALDSQQLTGTLLPHQGRGSRMTVAVKEIAVGFRRNTGSAVPLRRSALASPVIACLQPNIEGIVFSYGAWRELFEEARRDVSLYRLMLRKYR